jgi:DNA-binding MarR family transcriptional regulator
MPSANDDDLDDLLTRIHVARQRPGWRRRLLDATGPVTSVSTVRVLRAVEQAQLRVGTASVKDVAEYAGVEHSTASRMVAGVVASGLVSKASSTEDQRRCDLVLTESGREALAALTDRRRRAVAELVADWPDADVDHLVMLLDRLAARIEATT